MKKLLLIIFMIIQVVSTLGQTKISEMGTCKHLPESRHREILDGYIKKNIYCALCGIWRNDAGQKVVIDYRPKPDEFDIRYYSMILLEMKGYETSIQELRNREGSDHKLSKSIYWDQNNNIYGDFCYWDDKKRGWYQEDVNFYFLDANTISLRIRSGKTYTFYKEYPLNVQTYSSWTGSGFALKDGYIVTNHHVAFGARGIYVKGIKGDFSTSYSAKVVTLDKQNDLAILKVNDPDFEGFGNIPYRLRTSMAEVGEEVFVLGYPLTTTMGDEVKLTNGIISARSGYQGETNSYQITAPIQPGNSGGPLFDKNGNVIGVINAKHTGAENASYAIKSSMLKDLLDINYLTNILPQTNQISSQPLTQKVKSLRSFVYLLSCTDNPHYSSDGNFKIVNNSNRTFFSVLVDYGWGWETISDESFILFPNSSISIDFEPRNDFKIKFTTDSWELSARTWDFNGYQIPKTTNRFIYKADDYCDWD